MDRAMVTIFLCMVVSLNAINRPVYKIVLTQKGYTQFLQYDVVTPPLREFTFCTWIRVYDLDNDQSIFTYVAKGNNRVIRVWLDSGGRHMQVSINNQDSSRILVDVVKDVWRHVCLSYQSDYGAWALYIDSRLISCESNHKLTGHVLPGGGSVIIGYGTVANGDSNGFEGEIFGANMLLSSTIERNFTLKVDPLYVQKRFPKNKIKKESNYNNYVVLSDLLNEEKHNSFETGLRSSTRNFIKFQTPDDFVEHSTGEDSATTKIPQTSNTTASKEVLDLTVSDFMDTNQDKIDFWNTPKFTFADMYKIQSTKSYATEASKSSTKIVPTVSEYETPPPLPNSFYIDRKKYLSEQPTPTKSIYNLSNSNPIFGKNNRQHELSSIETPPPVEKSTKVYGQWTSSRFAGTVLNYLKNINFKNREQVIRRAPQTIPLHKISDSHPYPSEFKLHIVRPPSQFRRRKVVEKRYDIIRRDPQINVKILEEDLRSVIGKLHAETRPRNVEITNRGETPQHREHRYIRNALNESNSKKNYDSSLENNQPKQFILNEVRKRNHRYFSPTTTSSKPHLTIQSFIKSLEEIMQDSYNSESQTISDLDKNRDALGEVRDSKQGNKWHNAKSYSNDYTPRKFSMDDSDETEDDKKMYPLVKLRYNPDPNKRINFEEEQDLAIIKGRKLASEVSNQAHIPKDIVSILKYNHGYLSTQNDGRKRVPAKRNKGSKSFDRHVKIGNALNERNVIGVNKEQKERSFVGGNENIPDIHRYRSEIDNENEPVPPSLGRRECKSIELYDRVLYVQSDESIDMSHILSPVRDKNIAIEFIMQNYKKCSLTDSSFEKNAMLLIDWNKTPVRLFGGAYPRTTTDLCGFF